MASKRSSKRSISLAEFQQREGGKGPPLAGSSTDPAAEPGDNRRTLILIAALVGVVILVVVGVVLLSGDNSKGGKTATGTEAADADVSAATPKKTSTTTPTTQPPAALETTTSPAGGSGACAALPLDVASKLAKAKLRSEAGSTPEVCRYVADNATYIQFASPPALPGDAIFTEINLDYQVPNAAQPIMRGATCSAEDALAQKCVIVQAQPNIGEDAQLVQIVTPQPGADSKTTFALVFTAKGKLFKVDAGTATSPGDSKLEIAVGKALAERVS